MLYEDVSIIHGLCDRCGQPRVSEVARTIDPFPMGEDGQWIGGFTREKRDRWKIALAAADAALRKPCVQFYIDCENGVLCKDCLLSFVQKIDEKFVPERYI